MKTIDQLSSGDLKGKKVLMRADFDVPLLRSAGVSERQAVIAESFRIEKQKETIDYLLDSGAAVLMIAHISAVDSFSSILPQLASLLGREIKFVKDLEGIDNFLKADQSLGLLENTRTWSGERENDSAFAQRLAQGFDVYVNNAFAVCHREHASVVAITQYLPSYAGQLIIKETQELQKAMSAPAEGKIVIMGGAKASTKAPVIKSFLPNSEAILVGGVIANDILKAQGKEIGKSIVDDEAAALLSGIDLADPRLIIPKDFIINEEKFLDIGSGSVNDFVEKIKNAKFIIWNGPMGLFEDERFMAGTKAVAQAIADSRALSVIGGGDTILSVSKLGLIHRFSFVSTGGGAMLAFLAGDQLPGLEALGYYKSGSETLN
ncbi:MAG: phosphoglycerate kinase [Patescibacteria group bacterium]